MRVAYSRDQLWRFLCTREYYRLITKKKQAEAPSHIIVGSNSQCYLLLICLDVPSRGDSDTEILPSFHGKKKLPIFFKPEPPAVFLSARRAVLLPLPVDAPSLWKLCQSKIKQASS